MEITQNLIKNFLDYYRNQNLKKDTILNYERDFNQFFRLFYQRGFRNVEEIKMPIIEERRNQLRATPTPKKSIYYGKKATLSERTIQTKIQALKKFLEYTNDVYEIGMDYRKIKVPKVHYQHMDYFEKDEVEKIISTIKETEKHRINRIRSELLVVLGFTTWMRISEMLRLKVREVLKGEICILGKWDKERYVSFQPFAQNLLKLYLKERQKPLPRAGRVGENKADDEYVFISHRLDTFWLPITPQTVCDLHKKYNTNLNSVYNIHKKYTSHTLRSSFATHLLEEGVNIREIQVMLWHSDIKTTETYLRVKDTKLRETQRRVFWWMDF